jgi:phytanoyl-CoA dioxygenase PhyH
MAAVTDAIRAAFREQGFVVIPGALTGELLASGRQAVAALLEREPPPPGHAGLHFLWPRFGSPSDPLLDFYRRAGIGELAARLLRPDLEVEEPDFAQVATTIPPWPHRPGGPHVDGLIPAAPDGRPGTFTLLAGAWLTDQTRLNQGNLWIWPGTHLGFGRYLAEHGADILSRPDELGPGPYPRIELGEPVQATGTAGSVLFAHYLLAHNIGGHDGPAGVPRRETIYYRLHAGGHRDRWREAVTNPLLEFRP